MPAKVDKNINVNVVESLKQWTLNFTDIVNNNNKVYSLEIVKDSKNNWHLYSSYGRNGGTMVSEYRPCNSQFEAEKEGEKIIKSKIKKGYVEVKLAKAEVGSSKAQEKVIVQSIDENQAKKLGYEIKEENKSSLHPKIQGLMKSWFGALGDYVQASLDTKKCSLGQLSLEQINKGRELLLEARAIVKAGPDISELNKITSKYYSNIPMNFGYQRLDANALRFDNDDKLDKAFDILDTLEGAKDAEKVLYKKNAYDEQYQSLKTGIEYIDHENDLYKWIVVLFHKTRADNHGFLGKIKIHNIFSLKRDKEEKNFLKSLEEYSKDKTDHSRKEIPSLLKPIWNQRLINKEYDQIYEKTNTLTLFHGSQTPNFPKILKTHLLLPRPGFTTSGAMYGNGCYFGFSSKAANYASCKGSVWARGNDNTGFLFVSDVICGRQEIATYSNNYTAQKIKPAISVWAKGVGNRAGYGQVINDEFIIFRENGEQNLLKYIIEFETNAK